MKRDIRAELMGILPENKLSLVPRSYDIIGAKNKALAIVEIDEELRSFEQQIAAAIMRIHKNVDSVLAKESKRTGDFRIRALRLVTGDPDTEIIHRESGCIFKLDPKKAYFSPRESMERDRIVDKIREGEKILVMFSGVGSFPIRIAKKHERVKVTAVEINPHAHNYCTENIHLNRVEDRVCAILGDVKEISPTLKRDFDRIVMPLPKGAYMYIDLAVSLIGEDGIVHFYHWAREPDIYSDSQKIIAEAAKGLDKKSEILERVKVSQYSPRVWKIRVDARISAANCGHWDM